MKTNDASAAKSAPAGMNPGEAPQAADAGALRNHRAALPKAAELPVLDGTEFHVIKRYEPKADGYRFLHGVALAWHQDRLFASFGHNKGGENTDTEEARFCTSVDGGRTWSHVATIDPGDDPGLGVSHGVFLPLNGRLWAFHGAYTGTMQNVHTRAYLLDETTGRWQRKGTVVEGKRVTNMARWGAEARALVAVSEDYGRKWTPSRASNLPMATSKPCAGMLSTGQRFLICSTSADGAKRRSPLTIAVSEPGETRFSKVFVIRHAEFPVGPGESHRNAALSYPCALEHQGKLYVGYSNNGGNVGRIGEGRELWNNNSAELAIIPVEKLKVRP